MKNVGSVMARAVLPARNTRITNMGPTVTAPRTIVQDMPPEGGFKQVRVKRNMPLKFWNAGTTAIVMLGIMTWGWYRYAQWVHKKRDLEKEEEQLQTAIIPFLQSEHDIAFTVKRRAFLKKVEVLMKDEKDFDAYQKFYNNPNYFAYPRIHAELDAFEGTGLLEQGTNAAAVTNN